MKKLVSLITVLALVLCMATVAYAEDVDSSWTSPISVEALPETVTVPAGGEIYYLLDANVWSGYNLVIDDMEAYIVDSMWGPTWPDMSGSVIVNLTQNQMAGIVVGIGNSNTESEKTFTLVLEEPPVGSHLNPEAIELDKTYTLTPSAEQGYTYYYEWTAGEDGGTFTVDISNVEASAEVALMATNYAYNDGADSVSLGIYPGETVTIAIYSADDEEVYVDYGSWGYYETVVNGPASISIAASFVPAEKGTAYNPIIIEDMDKAYDFTAELSADGPVYYQLTDISYAILTIADPDAVITFYYNEYWSEEYNAEMDDDEDVNVLTYNFSPYEDSSIFGISSTGDDTSYTVNVSEPIGFDENAEKFEDISDVELDITYETNYEYYYQWVANADGKLTLSVEDAEWSESVYEGFIAIYDDDYNIVGYYPVVYQLGVSVNGAEPIVGEEVSVDVKAGDVVVVVAQLLSFEDSYGYECGPYDAYLTVAAEFDPAGSATNPIRVNDASELAGIEVAAGETVYYAISSYLNGQILTIYGDAAVTLNGTDLTAEGGVCSAELNGAPVNMLVVTNNGDEAAFYESNINWPLGSESNPIVINDAAELGGIELAAGETVYYAISSRLNGQILTIYGDAVVALNGEELTAVNGAYVAELTGAPVNMLVVTNEGEEDASYEANINWPLGTEANPIVINNATELTSIKVAAGETVYYAINSRLNGQILTINGDAVVTLNGEELTAADGVYAAELDGTPVNVLVVTNEGNKDAEYTASIAYAEDATPETPSIPQTGDAGIMTPVIIAMICAMAIVALVASKKKVF